MKLILHYLSRYKKLFIINVISVFGFALVELGIPTIIADMIDVGVMNADTDYIIRMGFVVLLISLIGVSMTILLGQLPEISEMISLIMHSALLRMNLTGSGFLP